MKIVVTSILRFLVRGKATPASHSWKCAMTAFFRSCETNYITLASPLLKFFFAYLAQKPRYQISKNDGLIRLVIAHRGWDASSIPQVRFPLVQPSVTRLCVDKQDPRSTFNEPSAVDHVNTAGLHRSDRLRQLGVGRCERLDFDGGLQQPSVSISSSCVSSPTEARLRGPIRV